MVSILVAIVSALSAILAVAVTGTIQSRSQRANHQFQLELEEMKHERVLRKEVQDAVAQRFIQAHKMLSKISREFSPTNLDIMWRAQLTEAEYDARYIAICEESDALRALIGLQEGSLSEDVEHIHGQMNIFWGNFKNVLYQTHKGQKVDHTSPCLTNAHEAASNIGKRVAALKWRLHGRLQDLTRDGT